MNLMMLTFVLLFGGKLVDLKPETTMEPIPDEADHFLRVPFDMAYDDKGGVYVLDLISRAVFMWGPEGKYRGSFGKQGQGPGEFMFMGQAGGPQASISVVGDEMVIYDGGRRLVMRFDLEGNFKKTDVFQLPMGRTENFKVLENGNFLINHRKFRGEEPTQTISLFQPDGTLVKDLYNRKDTSWKPRTGNQRGIVLVAFHASPVLIADLPQGPILVGDTEKSGFQVYDGKGKMLREISVQASRPEVTQADKDEFNQLTWIKNNTFITPGFPEKHPYYNQIMPYGDKGYVVARLSPHYRKVTGIYVDANGKTLGRLNFDCGESGMILGSRGKIVVFKTDEDGEFTIFAAKPQLQDRS